MDNESLVDKAFSQIHILHKIINTLGLHDTTSVEVSSKHLFIDMGKIIEKEPSYAYIRSLFYGKKYFEKNFETIFDEPDKIEKLKDKYLVSNIIYNRNLINEFINCKRIIYWKLDIPLEKDIILCHEPEEMILSISQNESPEIYLNIIKNTPNYTVRRAFFDLKICVNPTILDRLGTDLFDKFFSLRNFYIDVGAKNNCHFYDYFLNCVIMKDGVINFTINTTFDKDKINITKRNISIAMKKNVKIGIKIHGLNNEKWVFPWLKSLNEDEFNNIVKFEICTYSIFQCINYFNFVAKMKKIKYFTVRFCDGKNILYETYNKKCMKNPRRRKKLKLPLMNHLTELQRFSWIKFYLNTVFPDEDDYERLITSFCCDFLEKLPKTITQLYLTGLFFFGNSNTKRINELFPNLKAFMLTCVQFTEEDCLNNLKNLNYLMIKECPVLKVPNTVKACVSMLSSQDSPQHYHNGWVESLKKNKIFKKHHIYHDVFKKEIFFTNYTYCNNLMKILHSMEDQIFFNYCV
uniref:F-box domain-containing protein n=1 Tax=Strongyloides stercoralis TaxID=6248 RepID=A0A0K0EP57_STRER